MGTCGVGIVAMALVALLTGVYPTGAPLEATYMCFLFMCVFEACLGAYFALVASVKAKQVPEHFRAAVYGIFRVPLNVIGVILQLLSPSSAFSFLTSALLLVVALGSFGFAHYAIKRGASAGGPTEASPLNAKGP